MPIGTLEAIQQGGLVLYACLKAFLPLPFAGGGADSADS